MCPAMSSARGRIVDGLTGVFARRNPVSMGSRVSRIIATVYLIVLETNAEVTGVRTAFRHWERASAAQASMPECARVTRLSARKSTVIRSVSVSPFAPTRPVVPMVAVELAGIRARSNWAAAMNAVKMGNAHSLPATAKCAGQMIVVVFAAKMGLARQVSSAQSQEPVVIPFAAMTPAKPRMRTVGPVRKIVQGWANVSLEPRILRAADARAGVHRLAPRNVPGGHVRNLSVAQRSAVAAAMTA